MSLKRLVIPRESIDGEQAHLTGALHHYICHVLRLRRGDSLVLVDGSGYRYEGTISQLSSESVQVSIEVRHAPSPPPTPRLVLAYGLSRRTRTEWVLQKATELGVDWIIPVVCERSVSRPSRPERKLERWLAILNQATSQSAREGVPFLSPPLSFEAALEEARGADCRLLALPGGQPLSRIQKLHLGPRTRCVAMVVGPEGGFSTLEVERATEAGFTTVSLGPTVLRTETAAVCLLSLVAYIGGRLG